MKKDRLLFLDVNVLMALAWTNHPFHAKAVRRLGTGEQKWATCVQTQLGFIRLSSNPTIVLVSKRPAEAQDMLAAMTADPNHVYLEDQPAPLSKPVRDLLSQLLGTKQVTDAYLLAVARHHQATFLTCDVRMRALGAGDIELLA